MRSGSLPMYEEALQNENSRMVVKALSEAGGIASYSMLEKDSKVKGSLLVYHLNRLYSYNIVEVPVKGTYKLRYRTPLCYLYESAGVEVAYLGLLGRRNSREEPEPDVALSLLGEEGIRPSYTYVVTSPEALEEWQTMKLPYQWILCYEDEIVDIDVIKEKVRSQLEGLLRDYVVILDCTAATKPATIAYYELANEYLAPLIYIYDDTKQLKWLSSKETIMKKLMLDI